MKEYKLPKGWVIFTYIIAPLFIALFTGLAIFLPQEPMMKERFPALAWILPLPCLFLVLLLIYAMWDAVKGRFVIEGSGGNSIHQYKKAIPCCWIFAKVC